MTAIRRRDRGLEWWVDFRFRGKRIRKPSPEQTKRGTETYERALRAQMVADTEAGRNPFSGPAPFFRDFAERFVRDYVIAKNRPTVQREKRIILRRHLLPAFGHLRLDEINTAKIDAFAAAKMADRLQPKTVNNMLTVLRRSLVIAVEWGELRFAPAFHWQRITEQPFRFLSDDESARVLASADTEFWRTFILFLLNTGVRFGEAAALMWDDLELDSSEPVTHIRRAAARRILQPTKTGRNRHVPLNSTAVSALRAFPHTGPYVFTRHEGRFMDPGSTGKFLKRICTNAGIKPFGWHTFRHTFASNLTSNGVSIRVVQDLLGHASITMTQRYSHPSDDSRRNAVEQLINARPRLAVATELPPVHLLTRPTPANARELDRFETEMVT